MRPFSVYPHLLGRQQLFSRKDEVWHVRGHAVRKEQIARETGVDIATISRFMYNKGGLSIDGLDRLADCLGLNFTTGSKPRKRKGE